jgi:hypothetical protein
MAISLGTMMPHRARAYRRASTGRPECSELPGHGGHCHDIVVPALGRFSCVTHGEGETDGRHSGLGRCGGCRDRERPTAVGRQEILADRDWPTDFISTDLLAFKRGNATS